MSVPFVAFTVYAALTQVPGELLEAAEIDGAGAWQRFRYVVIVPTIRPVLLVVGLLQVIWDLRVFTQIYVLQKAGGITRDTNLLGTYIYRLGIGGGDFGTAAAVAIFMLAPDRGADRAVRPPHAPHGGRVTDVWSPVDASRAASSRAAAPRGARPTSTGVLVFVVASFPVYWMVNTSLLPRREIRSPDPTWLPLGGTSTTTAGSSTGDRFLDALTDQPVGHAGDRRGRALSSRSSPRSRSPGSGSAAARRSSSPCC